MISLIVALLLLALAAPLFTLIAILILLFDGRPVMFLHPRIGRGGMRFRMFKFRTMHTGMQSSGAQITTANDARVTNLGRILRRYRLDELPQIVNVIRGEMAMVGPRPEAPDHATAWGKQADPMRAITPGITDPGTLFFLFRETELITGTENPTAVYLRSVMPLRNRMSIEYAGKAKVGDDVLVLLATLLALAWPAVARPLGFHISRRASFRRRTSTELQEINI